MVGNFDDNDKIEIIMEGRTEEEERKKIIGTKNRREEREKLLGKTRINKGRN
jgi:hypothetical protein